MAFYCFTTPRCTNPIFQEFVGILPLQKYFEQYVWVIAWSSGHHWLNISILSFPVVNAPPGSVTGFVGWGSSWPSGGPPCAPTHQHRPQCGPEWKTSHPRLHAGRVHQPWGGGSRRRALLHWERTHSVVAVSAGASHRQKLSVFHLLDGGRMGVQNVRPRWSGAEMGT